MAYRTIRFSKCPSCGFDLYNRGNKMGKEMSEMLRARTKYTRNKINNIIIQFKLSWIEIKISKCTTKNIIKVS